MLVYNAYLFGCDERKNIKSLFVANEWEVLKCQTVEAQLSDSCILFCNQGFKRLVGKLLVLKCFFFFFFSQFLLCPRCRHHYTLHSFMELLRATNILNLVLKSQILERLKGQVKSFHTHFFRLFTRYGRLIYF